MVLTFRNRQISYSNNFSFKKNIEFVIKKNLLKEERREKDEERERGAGISEIARNCLQEIIPTHER